jgi:hypothetical protein
MCGLAKLYTTTTKSHHSSIKSLKKSKREKTRCPKYTYIGKETKFITKLLFIGNKDYISSKLIRGGI